MKLVPKLTLALMLGTSGVLALSTWRSTHREIEIRRQEAENRLQLLAHGLVEAVPAVWRLEGKAMALSLMDRTTSEHSLRTRFVALDGSDQAHRPEVPSSRLRPALDGSVVTLVAPDASGEECLYLYAPLRLEGAPAAALEIARPLSDARDYEARALRDALIAALAMLGVSSVVAALCGHWLVGRPVKVLVEQARRVALGDLARRLSFTRRDELGVLARESDAMCDKLEESLRRVKEETAARLASVEQLRHADRLLTVGRLAAGIAHELGTPLNVVSGRAKMIATRQVEGDEACENARAIGTQAERMTTIIRQLLDFARKRSPQRAPTDLRSIVRETLQLLEPLARKQGARFEVETGAAPVVAPVDAAQIQQVLTNLVVNAIQSMPKGGRLSVDVRTERAVPPAETGGPESEYARISVRDSGEGITPENIGKIFEPFFTTKPVGEGTGLGLAVSYGLVREHGGWIAVESRVGAGSTFSTFLPLGAAPCPAAS